MLLEMIIKYKSRYSDSKIFGLGNAFYNYIIANKVLEKDFEGITIRQVESICLLNDDTTQADYELPDHGVCQIELHKSHEVPTKFATLKKTANFLKNINTLFEQGELETIYVKKIRAAEIL